MKKAYFTAAVVGAFLVGFYVGCGDEMAGTVGAERYVYEVSEANVTGAGGLIDVPTLQVGQEGAGGRDMAQVAVYGSGYGQNNRWRMLYDVDLMEGKVKIKAGKGAEYPSYYYRVVVIH
ncbi:MAG: hypothetical protein GTN49_04955 [candidate division Zixibacteria bacterium]|nr:hypothetical protein [candidate division Zixibacteria bacterium]